MEYAAYAEVPIARIKELLDDFRAPEYDHAITPVCDLAHCTNGSFRLVPGFIYMNITANASFTVLKDGYITVAFDVETINVCKQVNITPINMLLPQQYDNYEIISKGIISYDIGAIVYRELRTTPFNVIVETELIKRGEYYVFDRSLNYFDNIIILAHIEIATIFVQSDDVYMRANIEIKYIGGSSQLIFDRLNGFYKDAREIMFKFEPEIAAPIYFRRHNVCVHRDGLTVYRFQ